MSIDTITEKKDLMMWKSVLLVSYLKKGFPLTIKILYHDNDDIQPHNIKGEETSGCHTVIITVNNHQQ